jgi:hypothetical protein
MADVVHPSDIKLHHAFAAKKASDPHSLGQLTVPYLLLTVLAAL